MRSWMLLLIALAGIVSPVRAAEPLPAEKLFARENLVAWCIVPFDAKNRKPAERAAMLKKLGFTKFAYDWRAEHIATFDEEIKELKKQGIELSAWWFPAGLNDDAKKILAALKRNDVKTQLWITMGDPLPNEKDNALKVVAAAKQLRPIAEAAAAQGCSIGLYNHGGWFGQPENQLAIIDELKLKNVGIVYNQHHGHEHLARFEKLLEQMKPHLYALNINGMDRDGEARGRKILPLGQGELDVELLRVIQKSGYVGPIGILGHTQDDAEARLQDNLDGLDWLLPQLSGKATGKKPVPRTPVPMGKQASTNSGSPRPASGRGAGGEGLNPTSTADVNNPTFVVSLGKSTAQIDSSPSPPAPLPEAGRGEQRLYVAHEHEGKDPHPSPLPKGEGAGGGDYDPQLVKDLVAAAQKHGDAKRGLAVLADPKFACVSCHQVGKQGGAVGPALTEIGKTLAPELLADAILWPKRQIKPEFVAWLVLTSDGRSRQGYKRKEDAKSLELFDIALQKTETIKTEDIEDAREVGTLMPDNLAASMTAAQRRDLLRLLIELGKTDGLAEALPHVHAHSHAPAKFTFDRAPLHPEHWPAWQEKVNRDRLYDFYAKEAAFFSKQAHVPPLLPAYPGLDGGKLGHWGNQNEESWKDDRWNATDLGTLQCGVFHGPSGLTVPKAVCVRLGEKGELSVCFNPETLQYEALWKGGFLKFSSVRHGFMDGLRPAGEILPRPEGKKPEKPFKYLGFFRRGPQVVFYYNYDHTDFLDLPTVKDGKFERVVTKLDKNTLRELQNPPPQWPQQIKVPGKLGANKPYAVDTIPLPVENPWKANIFPGDHAFMKDGTALVCTIQGDVWAAKDLDDKLATVTWRRFASGLHQALGMVVRNDEVYVLGRDQITRLLDANGDGEADFYQCVTNAMQTSTSGHDYTCGLAMDSAGRFYTSSGKQGLIRISPEGSADAVGATYRVDVLATGFRNPDGIGLAPDGALTVPCSEGDWTPASMLCLVKPSSSNAKETAPPHFGYGGPKNNQPPALPLVYLPRGVDNSSGGQVAVPNDERWGPLGGLMIHTSFGAGSHMLLLRDEVAGQPQGAVVPLVGEFRSGAHRAKFNPKDGQLYISGMNGWGCYTPDDGCFHRVRYTGERVQLPLKFHIHENGVLVTFAQPVDEMLAADTKRHFAQAWNYKYSQGYGSPELSTRHPGVVGHDALEIAGVHVVDKQTLFVELPELQPVNVLHLALQVDDGDAQQMFITVNKLDAPYTKLPNYRAMPKTIAAHPQLVDLANLKGAERNPWKPAIAGARPLTISADKNLTFSPRTLEATPGEAVKFTFHNPDVVPHNWLLIKPGKLKDIGELTNKLVADPEAVLRQYVPKSDDVLVYTDIVAAQGSFTIHFRAPKQPGRYPFLCTFPGHWMVMNGELIVK